MKNTTLKPYVVNNMEEECACSYCGNPFYVGDTYYYESNNPYDAFCGKYCLGSYQEDNSEILEESLR